MSDILLLLSAEMDVQAGYERYESFQTGRGDEFLRWVDVAMAVLENHPFIGPRHFQNFRRILVQKFPYGIFYVPEAGRTVIHAVLDLRTDPALIRKRLGG